MIWTSVLLAVELCLKERTRCAVVGRAIAIVVNPTSLEDVAAAHFRWCGFGIDRSVKAGNEDKSKRQ